MASNKFETELLIKAGVKGLESIAKLGKEIESAGLDVTKLSDEGQKLNKTFADIENKQGLINQFKAQKQAVADTASAWQDAQEQTRKLAKEWQEAKAKADGLKKSIEEQGSATKAQKAEYQQAVKDVANLAKAQAESAKNAGSIKKEYTALNSTLNDTRNAMKQASLSTKQLSEQEKQLKIEAENAEQGLSDLNAEAKRLHDIAKAKVTLGIDADDRSKKEIQEVIKAYNVLKNSGTLSNKELVVAGEKHRQKIAQIEARLSSTTPKLNKLSSGIGGVTSAFGGLAGMLATLGVSVGVNELLDMADAFKNLEARVKLATGEGAEFISGFEGVKAIADETFSNIEDTGELFARITQAGKEMKLAQQDVLSITRTINQAIKLSGGSAEANQAAITQLNQGLQSGVLRGEEFNSVLEQSPRLARALADGLGVTIGQLREMAGQGELTSQTVIEALKGQAEAIESEFEQMPLTVDKSLTQLKNNLLAFVGSIDKDLNASGGVANAIQAIANNIDDIDPATLDAVKQAFSQLGEIAVTFGEQVSVGYDNLSAMFNIFTGATDASEQVGLLTRAMQGLSVSLGAISDGLKGIQIIADTVFGALVTGSGKLIQAFEMITGKSSEMSTALLAQGEKMLARAQQNALDFESSTIKALENASLTQQQRLDETAAKSRQTYEQMAADGTASAGKIEEAFVTYAKNAIKANGNLVDARLEAELAEKGLQAEIKESGDVFISVLNDAKAVADQVKIGGVLKEDLESASASFKALGLDANEFATGLNSKTTQALDAFVSVAKLAEGDINKLARAYSAAKKSAGDSAQAQTALNERLLQVTNGNQELAASIKRTSIEQQNAKSATDAQTEALNKLGISMQAVNQNMSASGLEMVNTLKNGVKAIKEQATSADALKSALTQALDVSVSAAKTKADFEAINQTLKEAGVAGQVSAEQMQLLKAGMQGGVESANEAKTALKRVSSAASEIKEPVDRARGSMRGLGDEASNTGQKMVKAAKDGVREFEKLEKTVDKQGRVLNEDGSVRKMASYDPDSAYKKLINDLGVQETALTSKEMRRLKSYASDATRSKRHLDDPYKYGLTNAMAVEEMFRKFVKENKNNDWGADKEDESKKKEQNLPSDYNRSSELEREILALRKQIGAQAKPSTQPMSSIPQATETIAVDDIVATIDKRVVDLIKATGAQEFAKQLRDELKRSI